jgi:hypothetical protein
MEPGNRVSRVNRDSGPSREVKHKRARSFGAKPLGGLKLADFLTHSPNDFPTVRKCADTHGRVTGQNH